MSIRVDESVQNHDETISQSPSVQQTPQGTPKNMKTPASKHGKRKKLTTTKKVTEKPNMRLTTTHRFAIFMFTRPTYRIVAGIQLLILCLLVAGFVTLFYATENMKMYYEAASNKNANIKRMTERNANQSLECVYESFKDPTDFYKTRFKENWNVDLCRSSCGKSAYAFRINKLVEGDCMDKMDMVKCHSDFWTKEYCHSLETEHYDNFTDCPGKNKIPMPFTQVSPSYKFTFHPSLYYTSLNVTSRKIIDGLAKNITDNILKYQFVFLYHLHQQRFLAQSLIVRCPKCMVSSRCFTAKGIPPMFGADSSKNWVYRQLTTLRHGFPYYAQSCDAVEKMDINKDFKDACPNM